MLLTAIAQLRFAIALATGRPLPARAVERLAADAAATVHEFGQIGPDGQEAIAGPTLDEATRRDVQLRRFRTQAKRAAHETTYYPSIFADLGLDPAKLEWVDVARLPLTPKEALREEPDAFVRRGVKVALRTTTTGTTGAPTRVCFSARELRTISALSALGHLLNGRFTPEDVVLMASSSRATLGNLSLTGACAHLGVLLEPVGLVEPVLTLRLLTESLRLPGRKPRVSYVSTYPSYLGMLVEEGLRQGLGPRAFGLERIAVGGEVVTAGLQRRARRLFGEHVAFDTGYAMTETYPFAGMPCEAGHLHFEPSQGLIEVLDPETGKPAAPGDLGTLVVTPLPPFRETTLLLRYDTHDLVRALDGPPTCERSALPATGDLLGKRRLAVRHAAGWTTPRDLLEVLESVETVPLPARFGFWAEGDGVVIEAVVRDEGWTSRAEIERGLAERGVPLRELRLVDDPAALRRPYPLRGDLRELSFAPPPDTAAGVTSLLAVGGH
jgi:phenylacetate-coenzyme A ligase PaaK-like adenylate-forming protein